jgi:4-aminobutyrate aminotransferase-like enzyme
MTTVSNDVPLMVNAFDPARRDGITAATAALLDRRARVLGPSYKLFYQQPVHFVRAEGVRLYTEDGTPYLDVYNNVPSVGHCHPRVVEAQARQAATLNTHTRYLYDVILTYAEKLIATFPAGLANAMFTCTGSEANDLAFRIARTYTGNAGIIVTANGYHGISAAVAEASPSLGAGVPLGPHVRTVPAPDAYRVGEANVADRFAAGVQGAIDDLARHGIKPAALVFDTIFSSDGVFSEPPGFIRGAVDAVRRAGGLFIADEVQPGFARTGTGMWGFQRHDVVPDIVTLGKPMANGLPMGGVIAHPEVLEKFGRSARYFNTFGGNPVCCAAALAVLDVIADEGLQENARIVGEYLREGLTRIAASDERIGQVRGAGLFIGVDFARGRQSREPDEVTALAMVNRLRELRVLISASGPLGHVLKIRPPLPFSQSDGDEFLDRFRQALASV